MNLNADVASVARVASSFEDAKSTISELANSSENVSFVVMGGGFPNEEFEALREMTNVPWLRPVFRAPDYKQPLPTEPPTADEIASRVRKALDERVDDIKEGNNAEAVWYF